MPAPAHLRVTLSGVFGTVASAAEIWSCNLSLATPGVEGFPVGSGLATLATAIKSAFANPLSGVITGQVYLTRTRVALVGADGHVTKTAAGAFNQADDLSTVHGGGTDTIPLQNTLVATLHTAASGATGRGRIYLPTPQLGLLDVDGRISASQRTATTTAVKGFINAINTAAAPIQSGLVVCVASGGSVSKGIAPAMRPVTAVSVGRVIDTQRRRRGRLLEERVVTAL